MIKIINFVRQFFCSHKKLKFFYDPDSAECEKCCKVIYQQAECPFKELGKKFTNNVNRRLLECLDDRDEYKPFELLNDISDCKACGRKINSIFSWPNDHPYKMIYSVLCKRCGNEGPSDSYDNAKKLWNIENKT